LGLVDELGSSDDYLLKAVADSDVYQVTFKGKQTLQERIFSAFESTADRAGLWLAKVRNQTL